MPGGGTCTLRRLFHSPGTIGFYSPEPFKSDRREAGCTKLREWRCALKMQKLVPSTYNCCQQIEMSAFRANKLSAFGLTGGPTTDLQTFPIPSLNLRLRGPSSRRRPESHWA